MASISASLPVATLFRKARTANCNRKTVITANDPSRLELPATQTSDYSMCAVRGEDIYTCDKNTLRTVLNAGRTTFPLRKISGGVANMKDFRKTLEL